jgi:N-acetylmuramoyl-L-alanine amidase
MRVRCLVSVAVVMMLSAPAVASAAFSHVVAGGESLSSVAESDGLSVEQLAAANGLSAESSLLAGSTLMIPPRTGESEPGIGVGEPATGAGENASSSEAATGPTAGSTTDGDADGDEVGAGETSSGAETLSAPAAGTGSYVVQPGDTLSAIAARAGTSVAELAASNGIDPNGPLVSGAVLTLPGASGEATQRVPAGEAAQGIGSGEATQPASSAPEASEAASSQPVRVTAEGSSESPPFPTAETVAPSQVGRIAEEGGVPPSLAEAIANQESGFNNSLTSSADARGVMQILPGTWNWINETLAGPTPLSPESAESNVRGGVLLLHSLLESTGGNAGLAAAGYYQGLPSVLENGELPSTQQYVSDVLSQQQQFGGG